MPVEIVQIDGRQVKNPVAVWNMDHVTYTEKFEDDTIVIEPGHYKVMSRSEAVMFMGSNPGMDGDIFRTKNLEIKALTPDAAVPTGEAERAEESATEFKCHLDGLTFDTQAELDVHLATHSSDLIKEDVPPVIDKSVPVGKPICPFCAKEFDTAIGLRSHMNVHVKEENAAKKE